jgi:hypothetical protein
MEGNEAPAAWCPGPGVRNIPAMPERSVDPESTSSEFRLSPAEPAVPRASLGGALALIGYSKISSDNYPARPCGPAGVTPGMPLLSTLSPVLPIRLARLLPINRKWNRSGRGSAEQPDEPPTSHPISPTLRTMGLMSASEKGPTLPERRNPVGERSCGNCTSGRTLAMLEANCLRDGRLILLI